MSVKSISSFRKGIATVTYGRRGCIYPKLCVSVTFPTLTLQLRYLEDSHLPEACSRHSERQTQRGKYRNTRHSHPNSMLCGC